MKKPGIYISAAALLVYFGLCLPYLGRPGINVPHESFKAAFALDLVLRFPLSDAGGLLREMFVRVPMTTDFCGTSIACLLSFGMRIFGPSLIVLRVTALCWSALFMLCVFWVLRSLVGLLPAALALLLLLFDPVFIRAARLGAEREELFLACLLWLGLALCVFGAKTRRGAPLVAAAFVFGLGVWTKLMFFAYIAGALAALPWLAPVFRAEGEGCLRLKRVWLFAAGAGFVFGMLPYIIYNLSPATFVSPFKSMLTAIARPNAFGRDNLAFAANFAERMAHLAKLLSGKSVIDTFCIHSPLFVNRYALFFYPAAFAFVSLRLFLRRFNAEEAGLRRVFGCFAVFYVVCLLCACFVPETANAGHLLILWPFPHICGALALWLVARSFPRPFAGGLTAVAVLLPLLVSQSVHTARYLAQVRDSAEGPPTVFLAEAAAGAAGEGAELLVCTPAWMREALFFLGRGRFVVFSEIDIAPGRLAFETLPGVFYVLEMNGPDYLAGSEGDTFAGLVRRLGLGKLTAAPVMVREFAPDRQSGARARLWRAAKISS